MNVGKSNVMRCSRYVKVGLMDLRLNGVQLAEVDCFKCLGSQVAADVGCEWHVVHRSNEMWAAMKNSMSNIRLGIQVSV